MNLNYETTQISQTPQLAHKNTKRSFSRIAESECYVKHSWNLSKTQNNPSFNHRWSRISGRCFPTAEHSTPVERHVGVVNILPFFIFIFVSIL